MGKTKKKGFLDGAVAGGTKLLLTMPLDTVKVMMQINRRGDPRFSTMISTTRTILKTDGMVGLYAGLTASLLNQCGKVGIQFGAYEWWRLALGLRQGEQNPAKVFAAGGLAGLTEAVVWTTPLDRLKILRQASIGASGAATAAAGAEEARSTLPGRQVWGILRRHGIRGLYVGCIPTAIRQASGLAVRFLSYDYTKLQLEAMDHEKKCRAWHSIVAGAVCGGLSVIANNPVDTVKSRLQAHVLVETTSEAATPLGQGARQGALLGTKPAGPGPGQSVAAARAPGSSLVHDGGMWRTMAAMVRDEGVASLYAGCAPRFIKICAGQAIVFGVYENLGSILAAFSK